jgi:hypothetical protein
MRLRRRRSRIQEEIVQAIDSDRALVVREIVDDAGERALRLAEDATARLAEEATFAARSARRVLPSGGRLLLALVRRRRSRGRRRIAILIALGVIVAVGIAVASRRRAGGDDGEARERAMDDALMDSFPASDPPAPATAPRL